MNKYQEQQYIENEKLYLGRHCWKTTGNKTIHTGVIRQIRILNSWVEGNVYWQTRNGEELKGYPNSWERVANLGFESLPAFNNTGSAKGLTRTDPSLNETTSTGLELGPSDCLSQVSSGIDCQGDGVTEYSNETGITKTASQNKNIHSPQKTPLRGEQSEEANRAVNYRALLATIDKRTRDEWHLLCLNETLKREGCSTITLPAFKMRVDKFQNSLYRSAQRDGHRVVDFLQDSLNGAWHGSLGHDSIWNIY